MTIAWQSVRAVALMVVGPPVLLLLWAHALRPLWSGSDWLALVVAALSGLAALATAPWTNRVKSSVALGYILMAIVTLPYLGLLAICSTGDCL